MCRGNMKAVNLLVPEGKSREFSVQRKVHPDWSRFRLEEGKEVLGRRRASKVKVKVNVMTLTMTLNFQERLILPY